MTATINSEWVKLRSVRSTPLAFLIAVLSAALTIWLVWNAVNTWDSWALERQAEARSSAGSYPWIGDTTFTPAYLALAVTGTLAATSEYATGTIGASLLGTPRRLRLLFAKAVMVAGYSLVVGLTVLVPSALASYVIVGDRELGSPYVIGDRVEDMVAWGAAGVLAATVAGLVGLGLGLALRSTAMAITVSAGLLMVPGMVAMTLPGSTGAKLTGILLPHLATQVTNTQHALGVMSQSQAAAVLAAYLVIALGIGALVLVRRDAT